MRFGVAALALGLACLAPPVAATGGRYSYSSATTSSTAFGNLDTGHAWVGAAQSKNRRPIAVPLNATAREVLRRQLGKHPERVFTYRGRPISWGNTPAWRRTNVTPIL